MKATYYDTYGDASVLSVRKIPRPVPGSGELLVRVYGATVNRTDCANLTAKPVIMRLFMGLLRPKRNIPGTDFSGEVVEAGDGITTFKPGDRIWGFHDQGISSQAEYLVLPAHVTAGHAPDNIPLHQAVACLEGAHYALNFINKVTLQHGQSALVNGGTGAIGSAMIQLLTEKGIHVTATCRGQHKDRVLALGAEKVIDYEKEDFTQCDEKFNYVFDAVGKSTYGKCKPILNTRGVYISSEFGPGMQNPFLALYTPLVGGKQVKFPFPLDVAETLRYMKELVEKEAFRPLIDREYLLQEVEEAYTYVLSGRKVGNVILRINTLDEVAGSDLAQ